MAIGRPRVEIKEFDQTASIESVTQFQVGLVGFAKTGPIDVPTLITNKKDFVNVFGEIGWGSDTSSVSATYLGYALDFYLDQGNVAYVVRGPAGDGAYGYVDIAAVGSGTTSGFILSGTGASSVSGGLYLHGDGSKANLSATSASGAGPTATSAAMRVYSKYQGAYGNTAYRIVTLNYQFFVCATSAGSGLSLVPAVDYKPQSTDEFYMAVYSSAGTLLEEYVGSVIKDKKNARGDNIFIEHLVNNNSDYVAVKVASTMTGAAGASSVGGPDYAEYAANSYTAATYTLSSSSSGGASLLSGSYSLSACSGDSLVTSLETLNNTNQYELRGIAAPGMTWANASAAVTKVKTVAENRGDCVGFFDYPRNSVANNVATKASAGINSTWVAGYSNWFKYYDAPNDRWLYLPPSIQAIRAVAKTWNDYGFFYAPAGSERGALVDVTELDYAYTDGDLDVLASNQINPCARLKNEGFVLWGQKTSYNIASDFRDLNIRFLFITIEQAIAQFARALIFRFNNAATRGWAKLRVVQYLKNIQDLGGIEEFTVVCDSSNNTEAVVSNNEFVIDMYIKATKVAEVIKLNFTATRDTVNITRA